MSREARLVLGPQPFSTTKVLVVGGALHQGLHDKMLECLEGCNVTLEVKESYEGVLEAELSTILVLGSSIPTAIQIQKQNTGSAFLYCAQVMPSVEANKNHVFRERRWQACTVALEWARWSNAPDLITRWSQWLKFRGDLGEES